MIACELTEKLGNNDDDDDSLSQVKWAFKSNGLSIESWKTANYLSHHHHARKRERALQTVEIRWVIALWTNHTINLRTGIHCWHQNLFDIFSTSFRYDVVVATYFTTLPVTFASAETIEQWWTTAENLWTNFPSDKSRTFSSRAWLEPCWLGHEAFDNW